jgi:hypothetical protein
MLKLQGSDCVIEPSWFLKRGQFEHYWHTTVAYSEQGRWPKRRAPDEIAARQRPARSVLAF